MKPLSQRTRDEANIIYNSERQHFGQTDLAVFLNIADGVEALEAENQKLKEQVVIERAKWVKHCKRAESAEAEVKTLRELKEEYDKRWVVGKAENNSLKSHVKSLVDERDKLQDMINSLNQTDAESIKWWKKLFDSYRDLKEEKKSAEAKVKSLQGELVEARKTIDFLAEQATHIEKDREADTRLINKHYNKRLDAESRLSKAKEIIDEGIEDGPDVWLFDDELYLHLPKFLIWKKRLEEALGGEVAEDKEVLEK